MKKIVKFCRAISKVATMVAAVAVATSFVACESAAEGGGDTGIAVTGIRLSKESVEVAVGEPVTLLATIAPEDATTQDIIWSVKDDAPAGCVTVSSKGKVTAVEAGEATIVATTKDGGFTDECSVTATDETKATAISLGEDVSVEVGAMHAFTVTFTPEDTTNQEITWEVKDASPAECAEINKFGELTTTAIGSVTVVATNEASGLSDECKVTITAGVAFEIASLSDFQAFREMVNEGSASNKNAILTASFDMQGDSCEPVGTEAHPYSGTFDGNGFGITNYSANDLTPTGANKGIFGIVDGGTIMNLPLEWGYSQGYSNMGGIAATIRNGAKIINCSTKHHTQKAGLGYLGGIVGTVQDSQVIACTLIKGTMNTAILIGETDGHAGGIASMVSGDSLIAGCSNGGSQVEGGTCGSLVASMSGNGKIVGCFVVGEDEKTAIGTLDTTVGVSGVYYQKGNAGILFPEDAVDATDPSIQTNELNSAAVIEALNKALVDAGITDYAYVAGEAVPQIEPVVAQ